MLRLLILCLILSTTVTSQETEASGDSDDDDETAGEPIEELTIVANKGSKSNAELGPFEDFDKAPSTGEDGFATTAIIAAVCVVALAAVAIVAVVLVRRHMQKRQQGVYSVPVEQSGKPTI
ncbi:uncharacterized protein si:dkey-262k9.2 [Conger conger]|uniref:uncharacterized protein si:dkey-262k9.2 n=1 Tax=Conger conger TaxID=82655 RepID=UPI002A599F44|nr:uncharacterized protein si:dkey-262k9.2 [Conger conger]XP_061095947.1 uncharacterized protein si:dkey-262k9.2 [Conger conger]